METYDLGYKARSSKKPKEAQEGLRRVFEEWKKRNGKEGNKKRRKEEDQKRNSHKVVNNRKAKQNI